MTAWQFFTNVFVWLEGHTTRMLGLASGTLATLAAADVIPGKDLKYYMGAIAVLTYWRGAAITNTVATAKSIVAASKVTEVPLSQSPGVPR
jgi:hypothetical protein